MKTLTNIDEHLEPFEFGPQSVGGEPQTETYRRLYRLILAVGVHKGEESLMAFDLSLKLKSAEGPEVELSDSEHTFLRNKVLDNPTQLITHFHAQLIKRLVN